MRQPIALTVRKDNIRAVRLYTRLGCEIIGSVKFREPDDSHVMRRSLA